MIRRIVYQHTRGPWIGLSQILAMEIRKTPQGRGKLGYLHTGKLRDLDPGPMPDRLAPVAMQPDGRMAKGMRLKTTDKYVVYQEVEA